MRRRRRWWPLLAVILLAACGSAVPSPQPSPSGSSPTPNPTADCPPFARPDDLGPGFLGEAPELAGGGLVIELLVAEETGEADMGRQPTLASYRLVGTAPSIHDASGAISFEAGSVGACAVRIVARLETLEAFKDSPVRMEIDLAGATLVGPGSHPSGFCTWIQVDVQRGAAIECVGMTIEGPSTIQRARSWLRMAWAEPKAAALPAWAIAALGPGPTTPPGAEFVLEPVDGAPFVVGDAPQMPGGTRLRVRTVAWRAGGWVAAGGFDPFGVLDQVSTADAPVWFSADGLAWRRVDTPAIFGGPGYQFANQVAADATGWWVLGASYTAESEVSKLWRSTDGATWNLVTPTCAGASACAPGSTLVVEALASGQPASVPVGDGILGVGLIDGSLSAMWLDADGVVVSADELPRPSSVPDDNRIAITSIVGGGPAGWLIVSAHSFGADGYRPQAIAWTSADGITWSPLADEQASALAALGPERVVDTPLGWFAVGAFGVARSTDLTTWEVVLSTAAGEDSGSVYALIDHGGLLVALGRDPNQVAWSSRDGRAWTPIGVPADSQLDAAASDGTTLVVVGADGVNGGVWLANPR